MWILIAFSFSFFILYTHCCHLYISLVIIISFVFSGKLSLSILPPFLLKIIYHHHHYCYYYLYFWVFTATNGFWLSDSKFLQYSSDFTGATVIWMALILHRISISSSLLVSFPTVEQMAHISLSCSAISFLL